MSYSNPYQSNPYEQQGQTEEYELSTNSNSQVQQQQSQGQYQGQGQGQVHQGTQNDGTFVIFMQDINKVHQNLETYQQIINNIDILQKKQLNEIFDEQETGLRKQLDQLTANAQDLQYQLKSEIIEIQRKAGNNGSMQAQAENTRQNFLKLIQDYRIIEANYQDSNKEQAMRQYKIVQPDATDDEVEQAISDVGGQQIFSQALLNANRRGEAKTVLAEVQQRHQELLKLEKTMAELTQLFNDMEHLTIEQQENIEVIEQNVEEAQHDVEQGIGHTEKAVVSAKRARKNKIRCYIILFAVVAVIVIVVVVSVVKTR